MAITQVVVSATYKTPDGTNCTGTVDFTPLTPLQNSGSNIIVTSKTTATLASGAISVTLYATDDTDTDPDGALYEVTERITGADERSYLIEIPNTGNVNLADIAPATDYPSTSYATAASVVGIGTGKVDKTGDSMTGDLAMGSNKVTGLAAATATGHAARWDEAINYAPTDGRQAAATVKAGVEELVDLGLLGVLTNKRALRRFLKDAPVAATAVKKVVVVGDSIAEGALCATDPGGVSTGGFVHMLGQRLAGVCVGNTADYGIGWIGVKTSQLPGTFDVDQGATGTHGLGERGTVLDNTDYCEHTELCDAISVFYTAGTGTFTVRIDGTLVATIDSSLASGTGTQWTSSALTYGSHTVKVTHSSGTSSLIDAVFFHRGNATTGWQVHNGGHSGYTADDVTAGTIAHIDKHDPSLVIIHMGTNDYSAGSSTFATNLAALVASIQAVVTSSILLVVPHASSGRTSTQWDPFRRAVYSTAVTYGCAVVDCYDVMGDSADAVDVISTDNVHPNGRGHQMIADAIFDALGLSVRDRRVTHAQHLFSELGDVTIDDTAALEDGELVRMDGDGNLVRGYLQSPDLISSIVSALYLPIFSGDTVVNRRGFANGIFGMVTTDAATGLQVTLGVGGLSVTDDDTGYVEMQEITAPSAPSANTLRLYTVDDGGVTKLATRVNGGSSSPVALEAGIYSQAQTINAQTGTSYAPVLGDAGKLITMTNASASTLTLPANASVAYPVGTRIDVVQMGAGQVTLGVTSDTLSGTPGLKLRAQYSAATLVKLTSTTWVAIGDLAA